MPDTDLATTLDKIRKRYSMTNYNQATESHHTFSALVASTSDVPRLLAAVDTVVELADSLAAPGTPPRGLYEGGYAAAERQLGKVFREAVSRALLKENATDG